MNIKSIITTLAIITASSTAALAKPIRVDFDAQATWTYGTPSGPVVRDHRNDAPVVRDHRNDNRFDRPVVRDHRNDKARKPVFARPWFPHPYRPAYKSPELVISQPQ